MPVLDDGCANRSVTVNGTGCVVIQSPVKCAGVCTTVWPVASRSSIGKLASNDQLPGTCPVTVSGLATTWFSSGVSSLITTPRRDENSVFVEDDGCSVAGCFGSAGVVGLGVGVGCVRHPAS